jgi:hypothetical protein
MKATIENTNDGGQQPSRHPVLARLSKGMRGGARAGLACLFWLHALGISHLIRVHMDLSPSQRQQAIEWTAIGLIFTYSILAANGWWSLLFDLFYIYFYPVWLALRLFWHILKRTAMSPLFKSFRSAAQAASQVVAKAEEDTVLTNRQWLSQRWTKPFQQFAILWCLLTLTSPNHWVKIAGLSILSLILVRLIRAFLRFVHGSLGVLAKLEGRIKEQVESALRKVVELDPSAQDFASNARVLKFFSALLGKFAKRESLENFMRILILLTAVPYYIYLTSLFGFLYFGIGAFFGANWHLSDAMSTAISLPFSYTDLPHILIIRIIAWLQCLLPIFIGIEALARRMDEKTSALIVLAQNLSRSLEQQDIQAKLIIFDQSQGEKPLAILDQTST